MKTSPSIFQNPQMDGSTFYWETQKNIDTAILLFHGFTATTVEVRLLAKYLFDQGYSVAGPLLSGHGTSPGDLNSVSWHDWIDTAEESYKNLRNRYKNVFVIGESMGALLSLWLAAAHPEIAGMALFAPALWIPGLWQSNIFWPFKKIIFKKNTDESMPWQGYNVIPLHAASQLNQLQQKLKKKLHLIKVPAIVFQGKLDQTINPISSVIIMERIGSKKKELVWLEESPHCILLGKQLPDVESMVSEFITRQLKGK
jgi:carboxylesterase